MGKTGKVLALFNVRPGEEKSACLMLAHAFFMGVSTVYFETVATVHFLTRFSEEYIPYVYIVAAIASSLTGIVYAKAKEKLTFARLMVATLVFLAVFVGAFRVGLSIGEASWLVFALLVWYRIMSLLTDLEYWAVATRLYDVRQSKRLFAFVGTGEVTARTLGAFSIPLIVRITAVENLLILSLLGLVMCVVTLVFIVRSFPTELSQEEPQEKKDKEEEGPLWQHILGLLKRRYLMMMLAVTVFGVLGKYFVDFAFLAQMKNRYSGAGSLATFFGLFSGVTQIVNFLTRVFISGRLLNRFGVKFGLLVLPILHTICTGVIAIGGALLTGTNLVFWLVIGNQGIYKTLKHPIDSPSFKILYQPLSKHKKLSMQIVVELLITPLSLGLAGIIMIVCSTVVPYDPVHFGFVMLVAFVAWMAVAALLANREYPKALFAALSSRILDGNSLSYTDDHSMAIIRTRLRSDRPEDVAFALNILESIEDPELGAHLSSLLSHPSPIVREFVIRSTERNGVDDLLPSIAEAVKTEPDPRTTASQLRALCAMGGDDYTAQVSQFCTAPHTLVRQGAAIGLLTIGSEDASREAEAHLARWARSPETEERLLAAKVIGKAGRAALAPALQPLLQDPQRKVRQAALTAAGSVRAPALWASLVGALVDPAFCSTATHAITLVGEEALPHLDGLFDHHAGEPAIQSRIARIVGRIGGDEAVLMLLSRMDARDTEVRYCVTRALGRCRYQADDVPAAQDVEHHIDVEAQNLTWLLSVLASVEGDRHLSMLGRALTYECSRNRDRILFLLSFLFDRDAVLTAHANLRSPVKERRAYALEVLDLTLPPRSRELVFAVIGEGQTAECLGKMQSLFPDCVCHKKDVLADIIDPSRDAISTWTRSCAIYSAASFASIDDAGRRDSLVRSIERVAAEEHNALITETAGWCLSVLRRRWAAKKQPEDEVKMLTIEKAMILKSVAIFAHTPDETLAELATVLEEVEADAGSVLFEKGEPGDSMYVIVSGRVRIHDGLKTIAVLKERDMLGEMAVLDEEPRSASATAEEDCLLLRLDRDTLFEAMVDHRQVVDGVIHGLCERIRLSNVK